MPSTVTILAATLGVNHGYSIDGDNVHIHADIVVHDRVIASRDWSLQLWACDEPFAGGALRGNQIASANIGSLADFAESPALLHASTAFHPPAGGGTFAVVLLLVSGPGEIHGYANYPRPETFLLPRLRGDAGYQIEGRRITVEVTAIENPRVPSNLSGTLALELWALPQPYDGGSFNGAPLAAAVLGTLAGQNEWNPPPFDLAFKPPPDGIWYFCLMLREWTGTGYTTRDYTNFSEPVAYTSKSQASGESPVTQAPFTSEPTTLPAPDPLASPPKAPARRATPKKKSAAPTKPSSRSIEPVSVNKASAVELATIKGLSKPVATAIVAARPFKNLDALLEVKGLGPKLYAKLKPSLKL